MHTCSALSSPASVVSVASGSSDASSSAGATCDANTAGTTPQATTEMASAHAARSHVLLPSSSASSATMRAAASPAVALSPASASRPERWMAAKPNSLANRWSRCSWPRILLRWRLPPMAETALTQRTASGSGSSRGNARSTAASASEKPCRAPERPLHSPRTSRVIVYDIASDAAAGARKASSSAASASAGGRGALAAPCCSDCAARRCATSDATAVCRVAASVSARLQKHWRNGTVPGAALSAAAASAFLEGLRASAAFVDRFFDGIAARIPTTPPKVAYPYLNCPLAHCAAGRQRRAQRAAALELLAMADKQAPLRPPLHAHRAAPPCPQRFQVTDNPDRLPSDDLRGRATGARSLNKWLASAARDTEAILSRAPGTGARARAAARRNGRGGRFGVGYAWKSLPGVGGVCGLQRWVRGDGDGQVEARARLHCAALLRTQRAARAPAVRTQRREGTAARHRVFLDSRRRLRFSEPASAPAAHTPERSAASSPHAAPPPPR